jgi:hypothetical protein
VELMRALRIELRRSVGVGIALLLIALGFADFLWAEPGGWAAMVFTQRSDLFLTWPLALGAGAWQARRERVAGLNELLATSPRSPARRLAPLAAALAIAVVVAYLAVLLVGTVRLWRSPADLYLTPEGGAAALVGAVSLVTAAWLGLVLGRLIPSAFTAPVVTLLAAAATIGLPELDSRVSGPALSPLLPVVNAPFQQDYVQLPIGLSGQQGVWLAALAVTAFALAAAASGRGRLLALLPAAVAAVIVVPTLSPGAGNDSSFTPAAYNAPTMFVRDEAALRPVCTQDLPKVCVIRVHSGLLGQVTGPARLALRTLASLPDPPTSVTEVVTDPAPPEGDDRLAQARTLPLAFELDRNGHVADPGELTGLLLEGAGTPDCSTSGWEPERVERYDAARTIAGAWLTRESGAAAPVNQQDELSEQGWKTLTALPAGTQRERIVAFRVDALRCRGDLYTDLTRGPA